MNKFELLAPAGDLEKLKYALMYGADAVYFGGEGFSLRASAGNFTIEDMKEGIAFAHELDKKVYLTLNIYAHNEDILPLKEYLDEIKDLGIDGYIVSDPGVIDVLQEIIPDCEIHLSTQANMTNYQTAKFWYKMGVKRLVLARELTLEEIKEIRANIPEDMELEAFVHGAMCISYSGRCLLSNFMIERDANRGECAHPCRWKYSLVEAKRPGEYFPVEEDARGTYIMNSRDLCMLEHMEDIISSGIMSAKIEGRMKSVFYVAQIVQAYRRAIDAALNGDKEIDPSWMSELEKASHREFTTGFYYHQPTNKDQNYQTSDYTREYSFVGVVKSYDEKTGYAIVEQRNKMVVGDEIEVFGPDTPFFKQVITEMYDEEGEAVDSAPHPQQILKMKMDKPVKEYFILRKKK
ncbi:MAG: U32 family peptidase C-terminal domain-containing protein [Clostridia bacterium]|nr:U32 family peptidase C-terminal domain-containing protein [Clostridia bacterium]